jgi:hypothetical protein
MLDQRLLTTVISHRDQGRHDIVHTLIHLMGCIFNQYIGVGLWIATVRDRAWSIRFGQAQEGLKLVYGRRRQG